jgi:hypothetical protein
MIRQMSAWILSRPADTVDLMHDIGLVSSAYTMLVSSPS